ncbi:MAG TPA: DUF2695 domain-containing protein [Pseudonocardiaceae bacterium]
MNLDAAPDAEAYVADLQSALITPLDRECLVCYLLRMVGEFGCDGTHRWTLRWRELSAPRATALLRRLANRGGCCCDCEVLMNVYPERLPEDDSAPLPRCAGISRRGSTAPCKGVP